MQVNLQQQKFSMSLKHGAETQQLHNLQQQKFSMSLKRCLCRKLFEKSTTVEIQYEFETAGYSTPELLSTTVEIQYEFETPAYVQQYCLLLYFAFVTRISGILVIFASIFYSKTWGLQFFFKTKSGNYKNICFFILGIAVTGLFASR